MKLKQSSIRILILGTVSVIVTVLIIGIRTASKPKPVEQISRTRPELNVDTWSQETIKLNNKNLLLFLKPDCGFCLEQIELLQNNELLKRKDLLLVTSGSLKAITSFIENHQLQFLREVDVTCLSKESISRYFGVKRYPVTLIYNEQGLLVNSFSGVTKPELIRNALNE